MSSSPLTPADLLGSAIPATAPFEFDDSGTRDLQVRLLPTPLRCSDGRLLAAQWFEPPAAVGVRAVAVIGCATAVPASYYRHFAEWLAHRGYAVLSFDYRGIAASREALRQGEDVRLRDWARVDMAAALHAADKRRRAEETT